MTKKKYSGEDVSLETLLDLDGEIFPMDNGYWTKWKRFALMNLSQRVSLLKISGKRLR